MSACVMPGKEDECLIMPGKEDECLCHAREG